MLNGRVENEQCEKMNDEKGAKASMGGEPKEGGERKTHSTIKNWKKRIKKSTHTQKKLGSSGVILIYPDPGNRHWFTSFASTAK